MYINHEKKFIFVHTPKTAGSAMHIFFKDFFAVQDRSDPEPDIHHMGIEEVLQKYPQCEDYFKFGFVRNPWDRLVSAYCDFTQNRGTNYSGKITLEKPLLGEYADFEHFCLEFSNSEWSKDIHMKPQATFFKNGDSNCVDFVGKYENLFQDFLKVCQTIEITHAPTFEVVHRPSSHGHYSKYYSDKSREAIAEFFKEDIDQFGYEFEEQK